MMKNNNRGSNNSTWEMYKALRILISSDFGIKRSFNKNMNFEYRADCCYSLSCGYSITNIGIFNTRKQKVDTYKKKYEIALFHLAEKRFAKFSH